LGDRRIAVCRELTKLHEETFVGTASEALAHFAAPRGEIVLVIESAPAEPPPAAADEAALQEEVAAMRALGLSQRQAAALLGRRFKLPRRRLYGLWLAAAPPAQPAQPADA
jgi:16S rRNA (cytidine1402-2'-O)-methyltransferase